VDMHGNKVDVGNGNFEIVKHEDAGGQYLVMKVSPADASVEIDGQTVTVRDGVLQKFLSYGKHTYKAEHSMYEAKNGTFDIGTEKQNVNVSLTPVFGFLKITTSPESGADVYLNGRKVGKSPYTTKELREGEYTIKVTKEMFDSGEKSVKVVRNETSKVNLAMQPAFGNVTIRTSDADAILTLDGREIGKGPWTGRVERGKHLLEARRANHRTASKTIDVVANKQLQVDVDAPTPIVGSLNISSDPMGAKIKIDGKDMGETPNIISGLLIGSHTVSLSKQGCGDFEKTISIKEGKITPLEVTLEKGKMLTITTDKSGDEIYIDDKLAGTSPLTTSMPFGSHQVYAKRGADKTDIETVNVTATTTSSVYLSFVPMIAGHEYVDLGLPSGLKWATCNVGASKPEEYGSYFAWGETKTKASYSESNSATYKKNNSWLKSNGYIDYKGDLTKAHDAASANWGSTWRMPTKAEIDELVENTTTELTTRNGVKGRLIKSKRNGNSIFVPAAGFRDGTQLYVAGEYGNCWSSTPYESNADNAYRLRFLSGFFSRGWSLRSYGLSVRPVSE
ncbi:MAG: PEGA domain-containing protein, partial [Bacteroidaceae bacterium]|nr:PEGA domain-containing protein [Bacteroidaceae bacterium]